MVQAKTPSGTTTSVGQSERRDAGPRLATMTLVWALLTGLLTVALLVGGSWALWKDRVDRDAQGFVTLGTTDLRTETYAIVGDLRGDGPSWLYGATLLGEERVRATSSSQQPLFIGIALKDDVFRYLRGAGYATVDGFEVRPDTTHAGRAPSGPPPRQTIWAASTQGPGEQTLRWEPRSGDWSVVIMNADASANVDVHGDASIEAPLLPWLGGGLITVAVLLGLVGSLALARAIARNRASGAAGLGPSAERRTEPTAAQHGSSPSEEWR